jgi:hypothetical protein
MKTTFLGVTFIIALVVGLTALGTWLTQLSFNYIFSQAFMASVFGGAMTFWKAFVFDALFAGLMSSGYRGDKK